MLSNCVKILLQPVGSLSLNILKILENNLPEQFVNSNFVLGNTLQLPSHAFDAIKNQYFSPKIISWIHDKNKGISYQKILGICDVNAYTGRLNFIFGEAQHGGKIAVIYLTRLREELKGVLDEDVFLQRVLKEAVHELGHLFGLIHCKTPSCVMYFSNSLADTDLKDSKFCSKCKTKLISFENKL